MVNYIYNETLFTQVEHSIQEIEQCVRNAEMHRKTRVDAKLAELKVALEDLKNVA